LKVLLHVIYPFLQVCDFIARPQYDLGFDNMYLTFIS